jgi:hypothetical protein
MAEASVALIHFRICRFLGLRLSLRLGCSLDAVAALALIGDGDRGAIRSPNSGVLSAFWSQPDSLGGREGQKESQTDSLGGRIFAPSLLASLASLFVSQLFCLLSLCPG